MNKVSVITICYNNRSGLQRTMDSVASQTYRNIEYIVIDGGSTDGSVDLCKSRANEIDVFVSEPDKGIYDAMNKGIERASGEWIICMNSGDEFYTTDVLQNVFARPIPADKHFIYSDYWQRRSDGTQYCRKVDRAKGDVFHQSSIYRRWLHDRYGYYIITRPYIVADLLFFLSVPQEYFLKMPFQISINDADGTSMSGNWNYEGTLGFRVGFRIENIHLAYLKYLKHSFINSINNIWKRLITRK